MKLVRKYRRSTIYGAILCATVALLVVDIAGGHGQMWHAGLGIAFAAAACVLARLWLLRNAAPALTVCQVTLVAPYYPPEPIEYADHLPSN
jgi:hypothetical protein